MRLINLKMFVAIIQKSCACTELLKSLKLYRTKFVSFIAAPFDFNKIYADQGIENSIGGCINRQFNVPPRSGWGFDVFPTPGGGIGAGISYTWRF